MIGVSIITMVRTTETGWQWWFSDESGIRMLSQTDDVALPEAFEQIIQAIRAIEAGQEKIAAQAAQTRRRRRH